MKMSGRSFLPWCAVLLAGITGGWVFQHSQERLHGTDAAMLNEVLRLIEDRFVDPKERGDLYGRAIDGLIAELGDPHTTFLRPRQYEEFRVRTDGEYAGIGAQVGRRGEWVTVIAPMPGTPAERAGLRAGDRIIAIDGESARGWWTDRAVERLRGVPDAPVALRISRPGVSTPIDIRIVREEIQVLAVPAAFLMENGVGYAELIHFSPSATEELRAAIVRLRDEGARGLILDLRRNPGGRLDQGIEVSDLFLDRGQLIAQTRGRTTDQTHSAFARRGDEFPDMPLVVLVGPSSASASEIVAGALQDHDRALIVGQTSFGKGLVQSIYPLRDNHWLVLTTARWYTPAGRSIHPPFGRNEEGTAPGTEEGARPEHSDRPEFQTASGRIVYGGGGIQPDLIVRPDTFSGAEQPFAMQMLQRHYGEYLAARLDYAVHYVHRNPELTPGFEVTSEMIDEFYRALVGAGIEADRSAYDAAARWVALEIGAEIAYSRWGEVERRRQLQAADTQIDAAAKLLQQASSPADLLAEVR